MGARAGAGGLYKAVIAMLIESFSLYAVNFLLYTGPWIVDNFAQYIFLPILSQTQVRVLYLAMVVSSDRRRRTGYRPFPHCSASRQPDRSNERGDRFWEHRLASFREPGEIHGWWFEHS